MPDQQKYYDRVVQSLRSAVTDGQMGLDDVPDLIMRVIREKMWHKRLVQQTGETATFKRFTDFVRAKPPEGLGAEVKTLQRMCADNRAALDLLDQAVQGRQGRKKPGDANTDNVSEDSCRHGNSRQYALRRLRKSRPDLHAEVLRGSVTPNRAMQQAGFRPLMIHVPTEPEAAARVLARRLDEGQMRRLIIALQGMIKAEVSSGNQ